MPQIMKARLIGVLGDQEEFSHLIGCEGDLRLADNRGTFLVGGESVQFAVRTLAREGRQVKVVTKRGNVFTFRTVPIEEVRRRLNDVVRQSQSELESLKDYSD
jgi:hypothetical protein